MKYCTSCGHEVDENQSVCLNCGAAVKSNNFRANDNSSVSEDSDSIGWGILGFCMPVVGLIIFLVWSSTRPMSAKKAGMGALISVILQIVGGILLGILLASAENFY